MTLAMDDEGAVTIDIDEIWLRDDIVTALNYLADAEEKKGEAKKAEALRAAAVGFKNFTSEDEKEGEECHSQEA